MKQCTFHSVRSVKPGLDNLGCGDADLWGIEEPSLQERKEDLQADLQFIEDLSNVSTDNLQNLLFQSRQLAKAVNKVSKHIRRLREEMASQEEHRLRLLSQIASQKASASKFSYAFSDIDAYIVRAKGTINKLLTCNEKICHIMANLNETTNFIPRERTCDLTMQRNANFLHSPVTINDDAFLHRNPEFVRQRTDKWFEMRKLASTSASTLYNAMGLRNPSSQKKHYREYILGETIEVDLSVQEAMLYGSRHEVLINFSVCPFTSFHSQSHLGRFDF